MILSTCNRVEIAVTAEDDADAQETRSKRFSPKSRSVERDWVVPYLYRYDGSDAIRHLFRVASSLDSMVVGEPQILGQLKSAYALAKEHGALSGFLDLVMTRAFNVAKRVRSETDIGESAVSISYAAVELARDIFGSLEGKRVLVIGAGKMAESALRHLRRAGVSEILIANRTRERAQPLAEEFSGRVIDYDVVSGRAARGRYFARLERRSALHRDARPDEERDRPPQKSSHVPDRHRRAAQHRTRRQQAGQRLPLRHRRSGQDRDRRTSKAATRPPIEAEEIIREEVERMMQRLKTREVAPTIVSLQEQLEQRALARDRADASAPGCDDAAAGRSDRGHHQRHHQQNRPRADHRTAAQRLEPGRGATLGSDSQSISPGE